MTTNDTPSNVEAVAEYTDESYTLDPNKTPMWHMFGGEFTNTDFSDDPFYNVIVIGETTSSEEEITQFLHDDLGDEIASKLKHLAQFDHEPSEDEKNKHIPESYVEN